VASKLRDAKNGGKIQQSEFKEINPDVLIMSSFQYYAQPPRYSNRIKWWNDGQLQLLKHVKNSAKLLIYITDTPHPIRDIPACLTNYSNI